MKTVRLNENDLARIIKKVILEADYNDVESKLRSGQLVWPDNLDLSGSDLPKLPDGLRIDGNLDLTGSKIKYLPENLIVRGDIHVDLEQLVSISRHIPKSVRIGGSFVSKHSGGSFSTKF
jgi:hypothetical protein